MPFQKARQSSGAKRVSPPRVPSLPTPTISTTGTTPANRCPRSGALLLNHVAAMPSAGLDPDLHLTIEDHDEVDDPETESSVPSHNTPSRMPLIWRPGSPPPPNSIGLPPPPVVPPPPRKVPATLVLLVLVAYLMAGALALSLCQDQPLVDALYRCFLALTTIGLEVPTLAACAYLLVGLILLAAAFALVQDEVVAKCRQAAIALGLLKRPER